jgi:membrane protein required for colicin V production
MTIFDYVVLGIFVVSIILSIIRGLVREVLSIAGWVIAFVVAGSYAGDFEPLLPSEVSGESLRIIASFIVLFISVLLISGLIIMLLSALIKGVGLGFIDRLLGAVFGFIRGLLVVMILVLIAGLTALPQKSFWEQAQLSSPLETIAVYVKEWLPDDLSKRISYERDEAAF